MSQNSRRETGSTPVGLIQQQYSVDESAHSTGASFLHPLREATCQAFFELCQVEQAQEVHRGFERCVISIA